MPAQTRSSTFRSGEWEIDLARRELRLRGVPKAIGSRAFEVIEVLVQSAGELVDKYDLMNRVWPGAAVEENTLQAQIAAIRRTFDADRDLLKTVAGRGYRLLGDWTREEAIAVAGVAAAPREASGVLVNLPAAANPLIGRTAALMQLAELVSASRMVTLVGPGGIGKTVLALECARAQFQEFRRNCLLVELASLADPSLVHSTVASSVGLKLGGGSITSETIARAIGSNKLLLVLDNCEHLIDAAAELAETLIVRCPHLSIIATSREALRIDGECVYRVPPLDVPPEYSGEEGAVLDHGAAQLLLARIRAQKQDFSPRGEQFGAIAAICRRLDGIPLAIEFAAARAATLGLEQVADRLDDRLAVLTGGRRTALPRHQTLRATLDWSYRLLSEDERSLLRRLSVFAGGFTLEAALHVAGHEGSDGIATADGVANLVAKSLVRHDTSGPKDRWQLLETIRVYAREKLIESGEAAGIARRHANFFQTCLAGVAVGSRITPSIEDVIPYYTELDNVRAALDWCFSSSGDAGTGVHLTAAYAPVWVHAHLLLECRKRCEYALSRIDLSVETDDRVQMDLYSALGFALVFTMGPLERIRTVLATALELARKLGNTDVELRNLGALIALQFLIGESDAAQLSARRFLGIAETMGNPAAEQIGERLLGNAQFFAGELPHAQMHLERVVQTVDKQHNQRGTLLFRYGHHPLARGMLARVLWLRGAIDRAVDEAHAALESVKSMGDALSLCWVVYYGAFPVALMMGDFCGAERAAAMLVDSTTGLPSGIWPLIARCLRGKLMIARGSYGDGVVLLGSALDDCDRGGWQISYPEFFGSLAQGLSELGRTSEAVAAIERGFTAAGSGKEQWYVPELHRIRGDLLMKLGGNSLSALSCFEQAFDLADKQGALSWQLRAALSMAQRSINQEELTEARRVLAPIYGIFTEGFRSPDLLRAETMLASLT
jgi:predicted ATPase/DNA-binding winged helix-turn-helix (wHTH) protein